MRSSDYGLPPMRETSLTLDEVHWLMECVDDYRNDPVWGRFASSVYDRLLSLWVYWSRRTKEEDTVVFRVKR